MWFTKWFKPTPKIAIVSSTEVQIDNTPTTTLPNRLLNLCSQVDIDRLCSDTVIRRYLLTVHWSDIQSLFDALLNGKKSTPSHIAVNLYSYFKTGGSPPSVCLMRLAQSLQASSSIPYSVSSDIESLIEQLSHANQSLKGGINERNNI